MYYFKMNVPTWVQSTRGLLPEEEGVYFRLCLHYYDTEKPFPLEMRQMLKRLQLLSYIEVVESILDEYFVKTDKGWFHERIEEEIKNFRKTAKKNKVNGRLGGRPKRTKGVSATQSKPNGLPMASQSEPTGNPNQEPLTINQKECPDKKSGRSFRFSEADMFVALGVFNALEAMNPMTKKPNLDSWANTVRLMREIDKHTNEEIADLFHWANQDDFWHTNILSPEKLRKQWDTLTIQRKSKMNGGARQLKLPRDDDALIAFAANNNLSKPNPGEDWGPYRNRLNAQLEIKNNG